MRVGNAPLHRANAPSWCRMPSQPHPTPQQRLHLVVPPGEVVHESLILGHPNTGCRSAGH